MTDVAELSLKVDSSPVRDATPRLDKFSSAADRAEGATERFVKTGRMVRGVMGALGLGIGIRGLQQLSDEYTGMANLLGSVSSSNEQAARSFRDLTAMAMETRTPVDAIVRLYQRGSMAADDLGASQQDLLQFTENVGKALATSGQSAASASGALLQLSQALGGGVVRAEEFNSILEGAYPIAQAAARGIEGAAGSVSKLRNMVIEGEVTSKQFFDALLSQSDAIEEAFSKTDATIGQAFTNLRTSSIALIGAFNEATGASSRVADGILFVANNLSTIAYAAGVAAVAIGTRYVGAMALAYASTMSLTGALGLLRTALLRTGFLAAVVGAGYLIEKFVQLVDVTGSFGNALGLLKSVAAEVFERIGNVVSAAGYSMASVAAQVQEAFLGAFQGILSGVRAVAGAVETMYNGLPGLGDIDLTSGITQLINKTEIAEGGAKMAAQAHKEWAEYMTGLAGAPLTSLEAIRTALDQVKTDTEGAADGGKALSAALAALDDGGEGGGGSALKKASEDADALKDALKTAEEEARRVKDANQTIADGMAGVFTASLKGADSLRNALNQLLDQAIQTVTSNAFQTILGMGGGVGGGGLLGSVLGGLFGVPAYATGTNFHPGGLARINERGGEIVDLPRGSRVYPAGQKPSEGGGGDAKRVEVSINVNGARGNQEIQAMVNAGVQQGMAQANEVFAGRVVKVVNDRRFQG